MVSVPKLFDETFAEDRHTQVEPGKPDQFCVPTVEHDDLYQIFVAAYPVAWRVEVVNDQRYRGFEYIRSGLDIS